MPGEARVDPVDSRHSFNDAVSPYSSALKRAPGRRGVRVHRSRRARWTEILAAWRLEGQVVWRSEEVSVVICTSFARLGRAAVGRRPASVARSGLQGNHRRCMLERPADRIFTAAAPKPRRGPCLAAELADAFDAFFEWCDAQAAVVLDDTPISRAIGYARALRAFTMADPSVHDDL